MGRKSRLSFTILIGATVVIWVATAGYALAQIEQLQKDIDTAVQGNRSAVETAVTQASKGLWATAARTLLQAMPKGNIFQIFSGNKQAMERVLQYFPEAIQYAGAKVGQTVSLSPPSEKDVSRLKQDLDRAFQTHRDAIQSAVTFAQAGNWSDAVYMLCTIPGVPEDKCTQAFPEAIRYVSSKVGQSVAIADPIRTDGKSPAVNAPIGTLSTTHPSARTCIREERTNEIYCGQIVP
jgi:hypothetical protein